MSDINFDQDLEMENDPQLYEMFVENAIDLLDQIETDLLVLEENGENLDNDLVNKVFRSAHTIKGDSGFIGLDKIGKLAHAIENVLDALRDNNLISTPDIIGFLLKSFDQLRDMCAEPMESEEVDISNYVTKLHGIWGPDGQPPAAATPVPELAVAPAAPPEAKPAFTPALKETEPESIETPTPAAASTAAPSTDTSKGSADARILVIDDDPTIGKLVQYWLGKIGITCHCATSSDQALAMMQKQMYFIAICDINLEGESGIDLIPKLKAMNPVAQVIMLTGNANTENIVTCIENGAVDFLSKTNDWTTIVRPVTDALERSIRWTTLVNKKIK